MAGPPVTAAPRSLWRSIGSTAIIKVVVMGTSGLIGIVTSRMILTHFGVEAYAQYGLLASLPALLPFADLGIAAIVFNVIAASDDPRTDERVHRTVVTAFRILLVSGPLIAAAAVVVSLLGLWPAILGDGLLPGGSTTALICAIVFGFAIPLTVGQRILVGLGRNATQVAAQAVVAPFIFVCVLLAVWLALPVGDHLAVLSYLGAALVSVICLVVAGRAISPMLGRSIRDVPRIRAVPRVPVLAVVGPMLVQMIVLPFATQMDRILLSNLSGSLELARYNLGSQLFGIALQTISAAGLALWPIYAKARSSSHVRSPLGPSLVFLAAGALIGAVMAVLSPWLVDFVSDGALQLPTALVVGFVALVGVQAAKYPLGMYMTDDRGLRFQVVPILVLLPLNIGLSIVLIGRIGAAGPVWAAVVSTLTCQVLPYLWYVRRDLRHRRAEAAAPAAG
jgi:O-antigen/teichoic acid export membrane protein